MFCGRKNKGMKKLVLFVPHQDDETNLAGNILPCLTKEYDTYVIYSSLDVNKRLGQIRKKEALAACEVFGVRKKNIFFLEYPDTPNRCGSHFFSEGDRNIVQNLEGILRDLKPEIIIGTDFDFHCDHRMLSLALDEAVCNILREDRKYNPVYLKGFCYETAYYGVDDYSASALDDTRTVSDLMGNVSYNWEDRISVKGIEKKGFIFFRTAFKALRCHESQYAVMHARSVINADNVFWNKRTDNLLIRNAKLKASSGDVSKICDLKVIDTDDIISLDPLKIDYSNGLWKPDISDKSPCIYIDFVEITQIVQIVLHGDPMSNQKENCDIDIVFGDDNIKKVEYLMPYGRPTVINLDKTACLHIEIRFLNPVCISEIELFSESECDVDLLSNTSSGVSKKNRCLDLFDRLMFNVYVLLLRIKRKVSRWNLNIRQ